MICPVCGEEIADGQGVDLVNKPLIAKRGVKTGVLGFYPHPDYDDEEDSQYVHLLGCAASYRSAEDNPFIYEQMQMELREDIEEEVREVFMQELRDQRPMCPWCKSLDVWTKSKATGIIRYCEHCRKYWDEEEDEVAAA